MMSCTRRLGLKGPTALSRPEVEYSPKWLRERGPPAEAPATADP